jgi:hypothetical protein
MHHHPINDYFIRLARLIGEATATSPFLILMPTLQVKDYVVSGESLEQDFPFEPWRFVLSDGDTALIPVEKTLTFAAQFSSHDRATILYQLYMDGSDSHALTPMQLSEDEFNRVIYHSKATRLFFEYKNRLLIESNCGNTFGAEVKKLREGLRFGGVHSRGTGTEYNAGHEANEAIYAFSEFYENTLTPEEKKFLASLQATEEESFPASNAAIDPVEVPDELQGVIESSEEAELNFGYYWRKLARPTTSHDGGTSYCVELIGNEIDSILTQHSILFDTMPKRAKQLSEIAENIQRLTQRCAKSERKLINALNHPSYQVDHSYSLENSILHFAECISKMLVNKLTPNKTKILILGYLHQHHFIDELLTALPANSGKINRRKIRILNLIADHADITIKSSEDLQTLLKAAIRQKYRATFIERIPRSKWCELAESTDDMLYMMSLLYPNEKAWSLVKSPADKIEIARLVLENPRKLIFSGTALCQFVNWLPDDYRADFIDQFDLTYLVGTLKIIDDLKTVLALFPSSRQVQLVILSKKRTLGLLGINQLLEAYLSLLTESGQANNLLSFISLDTLAHLTQDIELNLRVLSIIPPAKRWDYLSEFISQHGTDKLTFKQLKRIYRLLTPTESITFTQSIEMDALVRRNQVGDLVSLLEELDHFESMAGNAYDILLRKAFEYHLPLLIDTITTQPASSPCFFRKISAEEKALRLLQRLFTNRKVNPNKILKYQTQLSQGDLGEFYVREQHKLKPA